MAAETSAALKRIFERCEAGRYAGGVVGQTLFMEGVFAFFAESSFLGLFLFGEVNSRQKFLAVLGVLTGIVLTILG